MPPATNSPTSKVLALQTLSENEDEGPDMVSTVTTSDSFLSMVFCDGGPIVSPR
jgi:hypothetical protein